MRFCEQSLAFSSGRRGRQLGYAGLACRFARGFVSHLLRFPPDGGGPPTWLRQPGGPFRELLCQQYLARSCQAHFWCAWGRVTRCTGDAGLGAPGTQD